jgi:hypothetical protein
MDEPMKPETPGSLEEGKEQVRRLGEAMRDRALKAGEQRREKLAGQVGRVAERLEDLGDEQWSRRAAKMVRRLEDSLERNSAEDLLHIAEQRIRERPGLFLAGCFALGFGAARLLRK